MTRGAKGTAALGLLVAVVGAAVGARAAELFSAEDLMRLFAQTRSNRADFVDRKYLSTLDRPLESSGELVYTAPSRLEKRTIAPKPETLVVDGNTMSIDRDGKRRSVSLSSFPEAAPFVESIRATLAGDLAALSRDYKVTVDGDAARWRLVLLPSDQRIASAISRVTLTGTNGTIRTFEVLQADGNRSVTILTPHEPAR